MILIKSISRFARNTVDCLNYIRLLKGMNIPVFFEKESIDTMDAKVDKAVTGLIQGIPQKGLISGLFANGRPMRSYFLPCCRCAECGWVHNLTNPVGSLNLIWVR